jgi:hypothetical protein
MRRACGLGNALRGIARHVGSGVGAVVCLTALVTKLHAQPAEPPPAVTTPAPDNTPPAAEAPPPSASEIAPPAPQLEPIQPSFPTPAPVVVASEPPPAAAAPAVDPLSGAVKFKPGKGLDIKSADGNWSLNLKLKGQLLDEFALPTLKSAPSRNYFFVRRMRLAIGGSIFTKDIKYKTEFTFAGQELNRRTVNVSGTTPATMGGTVASSAELVRRVPADSRPDTARRSSEGAVRP